MVSFNHVLAALISIAPHAWGDAPDEWWRLIDTTTAITDASRNDTEAALLISVGWMESGWLREVEQEERLGDGHLARGAWQMHDILWLQHDVPGQAVEAIKRIRGSFGACGNLPYEERLSAYASGSCDRGAAESRARMAVTKRVLAKMGAMRE